MLFQQRHEEKTKSSALRLRGTVRFDGRRVYEGEEDVAESAREGQ